MVMELRVVRVLIEKNKVSISTFLGSPFIRSPIVFCKMAKIISKWNQRKKCYFGFTFSME